MPVLCIQCALRAFVNGEPVSTAVFDQSLEEHMRVSHPNAEETQRERDDLERRARDKVARGIRDGK
jgi:hypothetical protein